MNVKKRIVIPMSFFVLLLFFGVALAAPEIDFASGELVDTQEVTVHGIGFGPSGPSIQLFDDFSDEIDGTSIDTIATVGSWNGVGGYGFLGYEGNIGLNVFSSSGLNYGYSKKTFTDTQEVFVSYRVYVPEGYYYPGATTEKRFKANTKTTWLMYSDNGYNNCDDPDLYGPSRAGTDGTQSGWGDRTTNYVLTSNDGSNCGDCALSTRFPSGDNDYYRWVWSEPVRWTLWIKGNGTSSLGSDGMWQAVSSAGQTLQDWTGLYAYFCSTHTQFAYNQLNVPGYFDMSVTNSNTAFIFDDIYVATGDNAAARVEVGDSAIYADCSKLAIITPTAWSDTSITATVRLGGFNDTETVYLFVIDKDNSPSQGFGPFKVGESIIIPPRLK